jgi:hypothetical protein
MNGLRIYINGARPESPSGAAVFYSRRGKGPLYRWFYEQEVQKWRSARLAAYDLNTKDLVIASWKGLAPALKAKLTEHYLE